MGSVFRKHKDYGSFYLQFVPGQVVEVVTNVNSLGSSGRQDFVNSILALPHIVGNKQIKKMRSNIDNKDRYFPLMRGFVDVPAKGDPVLLCTIGGQKYYLGPLNTQNKPNFNTDFNHKREQSPFPQVPSNRNATTSRGESINFKKRNHKRMSKPENSDLDYPRSIQSLHGDMMLEGRHGNSIRIGSRDIDPYVIISNGRSVQNVKETLADGSIISITSRGTLAQHFGSYMKVEDTYNSGDDKSQWLTTEKFGFILASDDIPEGENIRPMGKLIGSINKVDDVSQILYDYRKSQMLFNSDRITINAKTNDIYLSSMGDIHMGSGNHMSISTSKNLVVESDKTYLGDPTDREDTMEPVVMGRKFLTLLEEILAIVKDANGLFYGNPLPLVTSDMVPVKGQILSIEQKLEEMLSQHHFIEPNR